MLLPGHRALLKQAILRLSPSERDALSRCVRGADNKESSKASNRESNKQGKLHKSSLLVDGLFYPDMPCAKRMIRNGRVKHERLKLCALHRALTGVFGDRLLEAYASHNGAMSYLHAMAPDPGMRVRFVRDRVAGLILLLFATALFDDTTLSLPSPGANPFWIGQALHVLMDSYSPAHALRSDTRKVDAESIRRYALDARKIAKARRRVSAEDRRAMQVYDAAAAVARKYIALRERKGAAGEEDGDRRLQKWVIREVLASMPAEDARVLRSRVRLHSKVRDGIYDAFEIFVFNEATDRRYGVRAILSGALRRRLKPRASIITKGMQDMKDVQDSKFSLRTFFNYNVQSKLLHMRNDTLARVDKYPGLRAEVVRQCMLLLKRFLVALPQVSQAAASGSSSVRSAAVRKVIRRHITELAQDLLSGPLAIAPGWQRAACNVGFSALRKAKT